MKKLNGTTLGIIVSLVAIVWFWMNSNQKQMVRLENISQQDGAHHKDNPVSQFTQKFANRPSVPSEPKKEERSSSDTSIYSPSDQPRPLRDVQNILKAMRQAQPTNQPTQAMTPEQALQKMKEAAKRRRGPVILGIEQKQGTDQIQQQRTARDIATQLKEMKNKRGQNDKGGSALFNPNRLREMSPKDETQNRN